MPKKKTRAKSAAERVRAYRARKKALLSESAGAKKKTPAKSAAEHMRDYRARKKALLAEGIGVNKKKTSAKSAAEHMREYRARKKALRGESPGSDMKKPPPKSAAERVREYRARKKASFDDSATTTERTPVKSGAERMREYRARKKALRCKTAAANMKIASLDVSTGSHTDETSATTAAEHISEYTALKKALLGESAGVNTKKTVAKSPAERVREYRARKKASHEHDSATAAMTTPAKSPAERMREYRARKKALLGNGQSHMEELQNLDPPCAESVPSYSGYRQHKTAHNEFDRKFKYNIFGYACSVCDRLWFKDDLKNPTAQNEEILRTFLPNVGMGKIALCCTCKLALDKQNIPAMSTYNGFTYPEVPTDLPPLDLVSERLISPRIPFVQIRRLRHVYGQDGIYGQIINIPVSMNTTVNRLPRDLDDDYCINVHIKRKKIHKSSNLHGLVNKHTINAWLQHLATTPLYTLYNVTIDESFFITDLNIQQVPRDELSEDISVDETLSAQQQTLLWNTEKFLRITPGENNQGSLFADHAEELSFPTIYIGQFRTFREGMRVTPFMMATSELRRSDRRGVTPCHLLYMAMKILRLRVRDALKHAGKNTNITRQQIESEEYINDCIEGNLVFLRAIPNSTWYWAERKRDLFAMMRQLGKPTLFLTLSANEIEWAGLLQLLYKLKNGIRISQDEALQLNFIEKSTLINEDAVTCAIYFNKLVNVIVSILQSKKTSPFGKYRVIHYFKHIEFQHWSSPCAHILLWLENDPLDALGHNHQNAITLINSLISVSSSEASGNIELQTHKHAFTCYKKIAPHTQKCQFEAPFMPYRSTTILTPMPKADPIFANYAQRYKDLRTNLENEDYPDIDTFYERNGITSDEDYLNILRAGITRPTVFYKRTPSEKWYNPFNPFLLSIVKSNMDIQFITDKYSCAAYIAEYVNKTDKGISDLQHRIIQIMDEHPEFNIVEISRKMSADMVNSVEMTSQEAAWYLLREPMSKSSAVIANIPTVWPVERLRIKKRQKELEGMHCDAESAKVWKENWFDEYEKRPEYMENVTLAQFVSKHTKYSEGIYIDRKDPRIIRYQNYDVATDFNEYRREMVTLHIPFRNEEEEILTDMKFIDIYAKNQPLILQRCKEFESNLDINETIDICRQLCDNEGAPNGEEEIQDVANRYPEPNLFEQLYNNAHSNVNSDLCLAT